MWLGTWLVLRTQLTSLIDLANSRSNHRPNNKGPRVGSIEGEAEEVGKSQTMRGLFAMLALSRCLEDGGSSLTKPGSCDLNLP